MEVTESARPSRRVAAASRSNASATSGRIGLALRTFGRIAMPSVSRTRPAASGQGGSCQPLSHRQLLGNGKKALCGVAIEVRGQGSGRLRLGLLADASGPSLSAFVKSTTASGAIVHTDAWKGYSGLRKAGYEHRPRSQRAAANEFVDDVRPTRRSGRTLGTSTGQPPNDWFPWRSGLWSHRCRCARVHRAESVFGTSGAAPPPGCVLWTYTLSGW